MPTVYYSDGTTKKYKYYSDILKDPFLQKTDYYKYIDDEIHTYQYKVSDCPLQPIDLMNSMLKKVDIKQFDEKIKKTKSININGIVKCINCKYWWETMTFPLIKTSDLYNLDNDYPFVKKIKLKYNLIKKNDIDFSVFKNLEKLNLSGNLLPEIPESIFHLQNLQELIIIGMPEFPDNIGITKLSKNIGKLQNLKILNLSCQELTDLPDEFKQLKNLEKLYLNKNKFTTIPIQISYLPKLEVLSMNGMMMSITKDFSFSNLKNLSFLSMHGYYYFTDKIDERISGVFFKNLPINFLTETNISHLKIDRFEFTEDFLENLSYIKNILYIDSYEDYWDIETYEFYKKNGIVKIISSLSKKDIIYYNIKDKVLTVNDSKFSGMDSILQNLPSIGGGN